MSEDDIVGRLRLWLHTHHEDPRAEGLPFPLADIDMEAGLPPGSSSKHLNTALDSNWRVVRRTGTFIELMYQPRIRDVLE